VPQADGSVVAGRTRRLGRRGGEEHQGEPGKDRWQGRLAATQRTHCF
jgi:hypothetical protein